MSQFMVPQTVYWKVSLGVGCGSNACLLSGMALHTNKISGMANATPATLFLLPLVMVHNG